MVTVDDIATVVKAQLTAVPSSGTIAPGGHWFDRGPDAPDGYPYDVFKVEAGAPMYVTEGWYFQPFTVRIAGYCPVGDTDVNVADVENLFFDALASDAATVALRAVALRNAGETVTGCVIVNADGEFDATLREARDVFVCGLAVEMLVQGTTSAV